jgi:Pyruvate/2-oxoacid:ferredoxin oxidoreductase delta subunit
MSGFVLALSGFHLRPIYDEHGKLRYLLLKIYAWKEVELLRLLFALSRLRIMKSAWFRKPFYYALLHFLGTRGITGQASTLTEIEEFIARLPDAYKIAVGPCRCRVGNRNCDHEIRTDIVIMKTAPIWYAELFPEDYRIISKEEAQEICRSARQAGLVQFIDRHLYLRDSRNYFVICNCCKESCVPLIAYRLFKQERFRFLPSTTVVRIDKIKCRACGKCVAACPFEERRLDVGKQFATVINCQGCGLCVDVCPESANRMVPRATLTKSSVMSMI